MELLNLPDDLLRLIFNHLIELQISETKEKLKNKTNKEEETILSELKGIILTNILTTKIYLNSIF